VAVRLARAKGRADAMEEWLFANQPQITPDLVKQGARSVGGITDFDAQYAKTLELVKADIAMGASLKVTGTPDLLRQRRPGADYQARVLRRGNRLRAGALKA
jgi:hypothetical protein